MQLIYCHLDLSSQCSSSTLITQHLSACCINSPALGLFRQEEPKASFWVKGGDWRCVCARLEMFARAWRKCLAVRSEEMVLGSWKLYTFWCDLCHLFATSSSGNVKPRSSCKHVPVMSCEAGKDAGLLGARSSNPFSCLFYFTCFSNSFIRPLDLSKIKKIPTSPPSCFHENLGSQNCLSLVLLPLLAMQKNRQLCTEKESVTPGWNHRLMRTIWSNQNDQRSINPCYKFNAQTPINKQKSEFFLHLKGFELFPGKTLHVKRQRSQSRTRLTLTLWCPCQEWTSCTDLSGHEFHIFHHSM